MKVNYLTIKCAKQFNNGEGHRTIDNLTKKFGGGVIETKEIGNGKIRGSYFKNPGKMIEFMEELYCRDLGEIKKIGSAYLRKTKKELVLEVIA